LTDLSAIPAADEEPPPVDLHTLVAQFTALRHEVNLQTKAARASLEQNSQALERLGATIDTLENQPPAADLKPLLKAIVDVSDHRGIPLRHAPRQRELLEKPLAQLRPSAPAGFWSRLFRPAPTAEDLTPAEEAARLVRSALESLIAGYKMSLA